ncbi:MAG: TetR family transcriptional regulator [Pseudomonadota bacterium]
MARPTRKAERRAEILSAFGRCIARYGVEGATLDKVAAEAGLARALIRHNVGNRDELLEAFVAHYGDETNKAFDALFDALPESDPMPTLMDWLFDPDFSDPDEASVSNALFTAAIAHPALARELNAWTEGFTEQIASVLQRAYPNSTERCRVAAVALVAIYFNFDTMAPLGDPEQWRQISLSAAELVLEALD